MNRSRPVKAGSIRAVDQALRAIREAPPGNVPLPLMDTLTQAVRAAVRPQDLVVVVLDRGHLAGAPVEERLGNFAALLGGLQRDVFPDADIAMRRRPEKPVGATEVA